MARKEIKPRTKQNDVAAPQTARTQRQLDAMDLAQDTRGLVQFLDDLLTQNRSSLTLEFNTIDGLSTYLGIIDANLLGIIRGMDPDRDPDPAGPAAIAA